MRLPRPLPLLPALMATTLALAGCDTAEERAEKHYQRGLALVEQGETARALLEFRNVFRLDNAHAPALNQYAALLEAQDDTQGAAKHYLRVLEIEPHDFTAHQRLARILIGLQDYGEAEIHVSEALRLEPGDPLARALRATLDFRAGTNRAAALAEARAVTQEAPEVVAAHMILIADRLNAEDIAGALDRVDAALDAVPGDEGLHLARLSILEETGDIDAIGAELARMVGLFPENDGVRDALIQWHLQAGDAEEAEAVLRAGAAPGDTDAALEVVQFLYGLQGPEAAIAELERLIAETEAPGPYIRARAGIDFTEGRPEAAIAALRALLEGAEASEETRETQVMLAGMLAGTGAGAESAALIETVLTEERGHAGALKLRAQARIDTGDPDGAIRDLRLALIETPEDPEIMTLMALAHEAAGSRELMGERLALAVQISQNGVAESLRYAAYLMQEDRPGPARDILREALRRAPEDPEIRHMLGRIAISERNWTEAVRIMDRLQAGSTPRELALATSLEAESLAARDETGLLTELVESMARAGGAETELARQVGAWAARGQTAAARDHLDALLQDNPANLPAHLLRAGLRAAEGEQAQAEALYREAITAIPSDARPYEALVILLSTQGREADAASVAREGIAAAGASAPLQLTLASLAEAKGDIPRAVELYEALHDADPENLVAANNLASLLSAGIPADPSGRSAQDAARLARAAEVARGLEGIAVPPLQDTYGWILFLQGDAETARIYLEPAAAALRENAQAQYHFAEAAFALEDWDAAEAGLARALEAEVAGSPLPQAEAARARLEEIESLRAADPATPPAPAPAQGG
ncbi:tetratricopeptide repeat protein [Amaricoccus macauensis]|uniref:tetratricopeptide repeat protein n=1 Tax=Amaricoccus macauensis TaxID=57001 RepID=UPI003C7C3279